jgi:O-antigen biosynthesis protein WbqV
MTKLPTDALFGRPAAEFDLGALKSFYRCKRVLVTGAAGSIGSEVAAALAKLGCAHLALLDQFDHGLIEIVEKIARDAPAQSLSESLCDIRDRGRVDAYLARLRPDVVIHAAALKHVHLSERHPIECVLTNLIGVRNVLAAAAASGAEDFMLVSSDKAASPVCVMGATKRMAELLLLGFQRERAGAMRLKSVRFGNVWGTQGSVAPRFMERIAAGGPVEVTHADMQRFFMSADEAVGLILSVAAYADADARKVGAYYMEMGEPVSILDIARNMIKASGKSIDIKFTGLRAGEKLREELYDAYETAASCALPGVYRVAPVSSDAYLTSADVASLETMARTVDDAMLRRRLFAFLDARLGRAEQAAG